MGNLTGWHSFRDGSQLERNSCYPEASLGIPAEHNPLHDLVSDKPITKPKPRFPGGEGGMTFWTSKRLQVRDCTEACFSASIPHLLRNTGKQIQSLISELTDEDCRAGAFCLGHIHAYARQSKKQEALGLTLNMGAEQFRARCVT